jgi:hypothetical protein
LWVALGFLLRAWNVDPHIPGVLELFVFPILPFLQTSRFIGTAYVNGVPADQMVFYEIFGMLVGFAILAECVLVQRFVWKGYQLNAEFMLSKSGAERFRWAKALAALVSLAVLLWVSYVWLLREQARVDHLG